VKVIDAPLKFIRTSYTSTFSMMLHADKVSLSMLHNRFKI